MAGGIVTRVLHALAGARHGGAEMHFVRLAVALRRAGVEGSVLMRPNPARAAALQEGGLDPVLAPFGGLREFLTGATRRAFHREAARFHPDIVLTYMSRATQLCPRGRYVHVARLGGYYDLKYYRGCDHLVGITPDLVAHFARQGWPAARAHFIPNFVEDRRAPAADRAAFTTPADAPLVFALGRLHRNKGFDVLLEALARVPGAWLWLAGEGPLRRSLEALAARLGIAARVRFLGWHEDTAPLFAAADIFVVPSRHEPLGSVLLEGWMNAKPMIAAASQGPRFLLRHEETGLLVPVDDAGGLARAIARLLKDPALAARLAAHGRAAFEAGYTEAAVIARWRDLFARIAP